ncbi:putative kinesin [Ilyonectria destructans]|nr:putative kinesin [Ilyonectria destructans]
MSSPQPSRRDDFEVAIICALPLEYDAVSYIFDEFWDEDSDRYGRAVGDPNSYTTGRIGKYNVVLALLPHMGKTNAASAAASMQSSYGGLQLALLVGMCGAIPCGRDDKVLLGNIVISKTVVQYDFGRQYPDKFVRKNTVEDNLGRPNKDHRVSPTCSCRDYFSDADPICDEALSSSCADLRCDDEHLVTRERLQAKRQSEHNNSDTARQPAVHIGAVASGDTVMKSAANRNRFSREAGVVAFKIEGAGVWDEVPCIVVKGNFTAATAAAASKAILEGYIQTDKALKASAGNDPKFVKRTDIILWLQDQTAQPGSRAALVGLGGIGKSQVAIHYAHKVRQASPDTWVFWVYTSSRAHFEEAYRNIADKLQLPGRDNPKRNILQLVHTWLYNEENGLWIIVLNNANSIEVFFPGPHGSRNQSLASFLPKTGYGSIIITSRNTDAAVRLAGPDTICNMPRIEKSQALQLLQNRLGECTEDDMVIADLVDDLNYMPLAITQAAAYIKQRRPRISVPTYMDEFRRSHKKKASLLNRDGGNLRRDENASNSIVTIWQITFDFFNPQGIPEPMLQAYAYNYSEDSEDNLNEDLEVLRDYLLVEVTAKLDLLEMHALKQEFLKVMSDQYPSGEYKNWPECKRLDPHINKILKEEPNSTEDVLRWARLLTNAGWYRWMKGMYKEAEQMNRRALDTSEKVLGRQHPDTLASINNLALVLRYQGKYEEAEQINRRALDAREKYKEAEQIKRRALDASEKVLGREHPSTLTSISNLALVLRYQGKYKEAEQINRRALDAREKVLGRQHPDTLTSISNLALVLQYQGKYGEAEQMNRRALDAREKVLGRQHPDTLTSVYNLAYLFHGQTRFSEAARLYERACDGYVEVLGSDHPTTRACVAHYRSLRDDIANEHVH